jgi:hypothetical protein
LDVSRKLSFSNSKRVKEENDNDDEEEESIRYSSPNRHEPTWEGSNNKVKSRSFIRGSPAKNPIVSSETKNNDSIVNITNNKMNTSNNEEI